MGNLSDGILEVVASYSDVRELEEGRGFSLRLKMSENGSQTLSLHATLEVGSSNC